MITSWNSNKFAGNMRDFPWQQFAVRSSMLTFTGHRQNEFRPKKNQFFLFRQMHGCLWKVPFKWRPSRNNGSASVSGIPSRRPLPCPTLWLIPSRNNPSANGLRDVRIAMGNGWFMFCRAWALRFALKNPLTDSVRFPISTSKLPWNRVINAPNKLDAVVFCVKLHLYRWRYLGDYKPVSLSRVPLSVQTKILSLLRKT